MEFLRQARTAELAQLIALADRTFRPNAEDTSMGESFPHLLNAANIDNLLVAEEDGQIVSLIGLLPCELNLYGCRIPVYFLGSVCTDPAYRGRGLASRLLKMAEERIREGGGHLLLVSGDLDIYKRIGCMIVGDMQEFIVEGNQFDAERSGPEDLSVTSWDGEDAGELLDVQLREAVHFRRTRPVFEQLTHSGGVLSDYRMKPETLIARAGGMAEGYMVFGVSDINGDKQVRVVEFAGSDRAVTRMLGHVLDQYGKTQIKIMVPSCRSTLKLRLTAAGYSFRSIPIPGTIKVMDTAALWQRLQPYMEMMLGDREYPLLRLEPIDNGFRIALESDSCLLDAAQMTKLIFNGPHFLDNGRLKQMLEKVFPLPFDNPYNLNYV